MNNIQTKRETKKMKKNAILQTNNSKKTFMVKAVSVKYVKKPKLFLSKFRFGAKFLRICHILHQFKVYQNYCLEK